uniref:Zinc metalloproteinase nas-38-like isoform X2 n=1 Tax=Crassostrea virginica TaxID=6565 RepID=A0A8B8DII9_CRAVI|nr:zinc metalloproteinase nas-38-like isoform X2 [Crassostrea virginica]
MVALLYANLIIIVVSTVWIASCDSVEQITCSHTVVSSTAAKVFRYGFLQTPYPTLKVCENKFSATGSGLLFLIFLKNHCHDELKVYDSTPGTDTQCCECDRYPGVFQNPVNVDFRSDSTSRPEELGFEVTMIVGKDESQCQSPYQSGNNITVGTTPVIITSPNFPKNYPAYSRCRYYIESADPTKGLTFSFDFISLDFLSRCYDYIILRKDDENGNLITKICNGYGNLNFRLPENEIYNTITNTYLEFYSDEEVQGHGFRVHIRQASNTADPMTTTTEVSSSTVQSTEASSSTTETTGALSSTTETTEASSSTTKTTEVLSSTVKTTETLSSTEKPTSNVVPSATVTVASQTTTVSTVTADLQTTETILSATNTAQTTSVTMVSQASTTQSTTDVRLPVAITCAVVGCLLASTVIYIAVKGISVQTQNSVVKKAVLAYKDAKIGTPKRSFNQNALNSYEGSSARLGC